MTYGHKLKDPRWLLRRYVILTRDRFTCQHCGFQVQQDVIRHICDNRSRVEVRHLYYQWTREPWEYPDDALITLCNCCHDGETFTGRAMWRHLPPTYTPEGRKDMRRLWAHDQAKANGWLAS